LLDRQVGAGIVLVEAFLLDQLVAAAGDRNIAGRLAPLRDPLRANDDETATPRKFTLEGA